jgi:hypothetical protein
MNAQDSNSCVSALFQMGAVDVCCGDDFESNVDSVCQNLLQQDKSLGEESSRYWQAISNRTYKFSRLADIAAQVRTTSQLDILRLYDRYVLRGSPNRQMLSVQVFGNNYLERPGRVWSRPVALSRADHSFSRNVHDGLEGIEYSTVSRTN